MTDREQFEAWWHASKYCQVVIPADGWKQIALDAWQAARAGQPSKEWLEPCGCRIGECESKADRLCRMTVEIAENHRINAEKEAMTPDFEALRSERNEEMRRYIQKIADEYGVPASSIKTTFNPNACYCACSSGGPCEHKWDGQPYESEDGCSWSTTCSRCGLTAMSHDLRVLP